MADSSLSSSSSSRGDTATNTKDNQEAGEEDRTGNTPVGPGPAALESLRQLVARAPWQGSTRDREPFLAGIPEQVMVSQEYPLVDWQ